MSSTETQAAPKRPRGTSAPRRGGRRPVFAASTDETFVRGYKLTGSLINAIVSEAEATNEALSDVVQRRLDRDYKAHPPGGKPKAARKPKAKAAEPSAN